MIIICKDHDNNMGANSYLNRAGINKNDEFYTKISDISHELYHYTDHFKDKVVFCNCDDPYESNFFKYFVLNFKNLGLKKLICTCWNGSIITGSELPFDNIEINDGRCRTAYKIVITDVADHTGNGAADLNDIKICLQQNPPETLKENGDFRSEECIELLKESDIVVTNPPFSLFREFVAILMKYNKKFLIIGNHNAITYKEIFNLIMTNKIWLGTNVNRGKFKFMVPDDYTFNPASEEIGEDGRKYVKMNCITWFTNLEIDDRKKKFDLVKQYNKQHYHKFDNSDIINVDKLNDIPCDYNGIMGVPITFLSKYCPDQFEILGLANSARYLGNVKCLTIINGKRIYNRIFIKRKEEI